MREILFRGKRIDNGEWVDGYIHFRKYDGTETVFEAHIIQDAYEQIGVLNFGHRGALVSQIGYDCFKVDPSTVGQYIGITDRKGTHIFDGDLVKTKYGRICQVVWFEPKLCWDLRPVSNLDCKAPDEWDMWHSENLEVIGNVWDNPELLEATK